MQNSLCFLVVFWDMISTVLYFLSVFECSVWLFCSFSISSSSASSWPWRAPSPRANKSVGFERRYCSGKETSNWSLFPKRSTEQQREWHDFRYSAYLCIEGVWQNSKQVVLIFCHGRSESTGLDQKQISNWSTNHSKRHWKPAAKDISYSTDMTMGGTEGEQREELLRRPLCLGGCGCRWIHRHRQYRIIICFRI